MIPKSKRDDSDGTSKRVHSRGMNYTIPKIRYTYELVS